MSDPFLDPVSFPWEGNAPVDPAPGDTNKSDTLYKDLLGQEYGSQPQVEDLPNSLPDTLIDFTDGFSETPFDSPGNELEEEHVFLDFGGSEGRTGGEQLMPQSHNEVDLLGSCDTQFEGALVDIPPPMEFFSGSCTGVSGNSQTYSTPVTNIDDLLGIDFLCSSDPALADMADCLTCPGSNTALLGGAENGFEFVWDSKENGELENDDDDDLPPELPADPPPPIPDNSPPVSSIRQILSPTTDLLFPVTKDPSSIVAHDQSSILSAKETLPTSTMDLHSDQSESIDILPSCYTESLPSVPTATDSTEDADVGNADAHLRNGEESNDESATTSIFIPSQNPLDNVTQISVESDHRVVGNSLIRTTSTTTANNNTIHRTDIMVTSPSSNVSEITVNATKAATPDTESSKESTPTPGPIPGPLVVTVNNSCQPTSAQIQFDNSTQEATVRSAMPTNAFLPTSVGVTKTSKQPCQRNGDDGDMEDEEEIAPMMVYRDHQGNKLAAPSPPGTVSKPVNGRKELDQGAKLDLQTVLSRMSESRDTAKVTQHGTLAENTTVAEDEIVAIQHSRQETERAKEMLSKWTSRDTGSALNTAASTQQSHFQKAVGTVIDVKSGKVQLPSESVYLTTIGITNTFPARKNESIQEAEDEIVSMTVHKDHLGNKHYAPSPPDTFGKQTGLRQLDVAAKEDIADLLSSMTTTTNNGRMSATQPEVDIAEDPVQAIVLSREESCLAMKALNRWMNDGLEQSPPSSPQFQQLVMQIIDSADKSYTKDKEDYSDSQTTSSIISSVDEEDVENTSTQTVEAAITSLHPTQQLEPLNPEIDEEINPEIQEAQGIQEVPVIEQQYSISTVIPKLPFEETVPENMTEDNMQYQTNRCIENNNVEPKSKSNASHSTIGAGQSPSTTNSITTNSTTTKNGTTTTSTIANNKPTTTTTTTASRVTTIAVSAEPKPSMSAQRGLRAPTKIASLSQASPRSSKPLVRPGAAAIRGLTIPLAGSRLSSKTEYGKTRSEESPFLVEVLKGIVGPGIKVKVNDEGHVEVTEVHRNSPVAKNGNIKVGDFLLAINTTELKGLTDGRVQQILRLLPRGLVKFFVSIRPPQLINGHGEEATHPACQRSRGAYSQFGVRLSPQPFSPTSSEGQAPSLTSLPRQQSQEVVVSSPVSNQSATEKTQGQKDLVSSTGTPSCSPVVSHTQSCSLVQRELSSSSSTTDARKDSSLGDDASNGTHQTYEVGDSPATFFTDNHGLGAGAKQKEISASSTSSSSVASEVPLSISVGNEQEEDDMATRKLSKALSPRLKPEPMSPSPKPAPRQRGSMLSALSPRMTTSPDEGHDEGRDNDLPTPASPSAQRATSLRKQTEEVPVSHHPSPTVSSVSMDRPAPSVSSPRQGRIFTFDDEAIKATPVPTPRHRPKSVIDKNHAGPNDGLASTNVMYQGSVKQTDCKPKPAERNRNAKDKVVHAHLVTISPDPVELKSEVQAAKAPCNEAGGPKRLKSPVHPNDSVKNLRAANRMATRLSDSVLSTGDNPPPHRQFVSSAARMFEQKASENSSSSTLPRSTRSSVSVSSVVQSFNRNSEFDSASTSGRATRRPSESVYGRPVNNSTLSGNDRRRSTASPLSGPSSLYRSMPDLSTVHDSSVTRSRNLRLDDSDPNRFSRVNSSGKAKQDTSNTTSLKSVLASRDGLPEWPPSVGKKDKSRVTSSVSSVTLRSQSPVHDSHSACSRSNRLSWSSQSSDTHISRFTVPSSSLRRSAYFGSTPSLAPTTELSEKHVQSAMKQFDDLLSDKHTMDSDDELPKVSNSVSLDLHKLRSRGRVETNVKSSEQSPAKAELVHKAEAEIMQKTKTAPSLKDDSVSGQKSETVQVKRVENVQVEKTVAVLPSCEKSPVSVVVEQRKTMSKKESDDRTASAESRSPRKFVFGQGSNPDIQLIVKSTKSVAVAAKDSAVHVTTQEPVENQPEKCNENHIKTVSVHKAEDEKLCSTSYQPENLPDKTVSVTKTVASRPVEVKKPEQDGTSVELLSQEGHNTGQSPKVIDDIVDAYPEEDVAAALDIAIVEQSFHTKQSHSVIDNAVCEETAPSPTQTIMVEEQNVVNINTEERKDDGDSDDDSSPPPLPEEGPPPLPSAPPPMLATTSNVDTVGEKLMLPAQEATYRPSQVVGDKAEVAPVGDDQSYDVEQVVDERSDPSYNVPMEQNLAWKSNIPMEQNLVLQNSTSMEQNRVLQNSMSMEEQQSTSTGSDLISFPSSQLPTPSLPLTTHTDLLPGLDLLKKSNDEENSQDNPPVSDTLSQDSGVQDEDMSEDGLRFSQDESPSSTGLFESVMTPDDISAPLLTESKNDQPLQTEAAVETISVSKSPVPSPRRSLHATSRSPVPHMTSLTAQESTAVQSSQNSPRVDNVIDSVPQGSVSPRCSSGQQETEVSTLRGGVSTTGEDNEHIVSSGDKTASVQLVSDNAVSVDKADDVKVSGEKCYRLETKRDNAVSMQHEVIDVHKYTEESQNADGNSVEKQSVDTDTGSPPDSPNAPNSPTEEDDNEVLSEEENSFSELAKITSSRRWCILDQSGSLFLQGGNGCPVDVDRPTLRQISSMMPSQFDSMLTSGNKDLDSAQLPVSVELMVVSARELSGKAVRVDVYQREDYFVQVTNVISKGSSVLEADLLLSVEGRTLRNRRPAQVHRLLEDTGPKGIILIARGLKLPSSAVRMTETHTEERANTPPATHTPVPSPAPTPTSTPVQVGEGIYEVTLAVGPTGVGFCLEGGKASLQGDLPILIKRIFKGTLADKGGFLKAKDEILSVNGVDFTTMGHYEAWNHLKALKDGEIRLRIKKHE